VFRVLAIVLSVSGLQGFVHTGPNMPVCSATSPCDSPAHVTLVFRRGGFARRAATDSEGAYRVSLPPGLYSVGVLERVGIGGRIRPARVHVRSGKVDRIDFSIDTGIR
jgi:hypothetical protein